MMVRGFSLYFDMLRYPRAREINIRIHGKGQVKSSSVVMTYRHRDTSLSLAEQAVQGHTPNTSS